ncbi:MAG TPA: O-antigen ligase family protein [Syntrophomonadaceae bacterium]|nr:O-antigen ligase family protein [Syntrophomonadaceae bacterium]
MTKKKTQQKTKNTPQLKTWLPIATFIALGILIFYPPFFRGLFFKEDMFLYHIFTAVVFTLIWVYKIYKKDYTFLKTPLDWAILAYAGAYLLSLIGAVHPGEAFYGFLKVLNYFMVYWMVTQLVKDYKTYENILKVLLAAGTSVAMIGILAATGYSNYPSAFDGRVILSTLQYPNTTAAYLAVISLVAITMLVIEKRLLTKIIYLTTTFLMMLVILCSLSKGAWLIFIIGGLLLLIGMPGLHKIKSLYNLGIAFIAALITYSKFYPAIRAEEPAILYLLIGFLIVILGQLAWEGFRLLNKKAGLKTTIITISLIGLVTLGAGSMFLLGGDDSTFKAEDITNELSRFTNISDSSYTARADFIRWGVAIVKDYPINGTGAGGWNALYHQYQDYLTFTTEAHNHFIQVWVEAGTIGLIAFISIWGLLIFSTYKTYRREKEKGNLQGQVLIWGTFTAAIALGVHAAMDFDLSLAAIALLLWILFALISAVSYFDTEENQEVNKFNNLPPVFNLSISILCVLTLIICGSSYYIAYQNAVKASTAMQAMTPDKSAEEQNELYQTALKYYEKATNLDANNAEYYTDLAYAYAIRYSNLRQAGHQLADQAYQDTIKVIERAEKLKGYDPKVRSSLLNTARMLGDLQVLLRQADGAVLSNPNDINAYESLVQVLWAGLEHYKQAGDEEQTTVFADRLTAINDQIETQKAKRNLNRPYWNGKPLNLSSEALVNIAKANYIVGDYAKSLPIFETNVTNLLKLEFEDTEFANTALENENWSISTVKDNEAVNGFSLKVIAKSDLGGWPTVLDLASQISVHEGTEYVLEVRYKIDSLTHGDIADTSNSIGIWGSTTGDAESKNTAFAFHNGLVKNPQTTWQIAKQSLLVDEGHNARNFRIGTGSIGKGSTFLIDYIKFYPVLNQNTPTPILEQYAWYAATLNKTGKTTDAQNIAEQLKAIDGDMYKVYEELLESEK